LILGVKAPGIMTARDYFSLHNSTDLFLDVSFLYLNQWCHLGKLAGYAFSPHVISRQGVDWYWDSFGLQAREHDSWYC